jgi:hypothetical protein
MRATCDVFESWATPAKGFYALETFDDETFRWVNNDAVVMLHAERGAALSFFVEQGPGLDGAPFSLAIGRPDGTEIVAVWIASRTWVHVPMAGLEDTDRLTMRCEGGGKAVAGDPRLLNFRIFACEA